MFFFIYINDLPNYVTNNIKQYVDDSKILTIVKNWVEMSIVQEDLDSISKWMNDLGMQQNKKKSKA